MHNTYRLPRNWRQNIEFVVSKDDGPDGEVLTIEIRFKAGKKPKGFGQDIGEITVYVANPCFIERSSIKEKMQHRGLGKELYMEACKELGKISTKYHEASEKAQRLWKSLIKEYKHELDFFDQRITLYPRKKRKKKNEI